EIPPWQIALDADPLPYPERPAVERSAQELELRGMGPLAKDRRRRLALGQIGLERRERRGLHARERVVREDEGRLLFGGHPGERVLGPGERDGEELRRGHLDRRGHGRRRGRHGGGASDGAEGRGEQEGGERDQRQKAGFHRVLRKAIRAARSFPERW